jgi:hypothetical protein
MVALLILSLLAVIITFSRIRSHNKRLLAERNFHRIAELKFWRFVDLLLNLACLSGAVMVASKLATSLIFAVGLFWFVAAMMLIAVQEHDEQIAKTRAYLMVEYGSYFSDFAVKQHLKKEKNEMKFAKKQAQEKAAWKNGYPPKN